MKNGLILAFICLLLTSCHMQFLLMPFAEMHGEGDVDYGPNYYDHKIPNTITFRQMVEDYAVTDSKVDVQFFKGEWLRPLKINTKITGTTFNFRIDFRNYDTSILDKVVFNSLTMTANGAVTDLFTTEDIECLLPASDADEEEAGRRLKEDKEVVFNNSNYSFYMLLFNDLAIDYTVTKKLTFDYNITVYKLDGTQITETKSAKYTRR